MTVSQDPRNRVFYWDQRVCASPDGRLASFSWTYDRKNHKYLNIHRNISIDNGHSWKGFEDLGFADQGSRPAVLPDGRVVLAWVDRFNTSTIRARMAASIDAPFLEETEIVVYRHHKDSQVGNSEGELLDEMGKWSFGLPFAEALYNGEVLIGYYAGTDTCMDFRWARLQIEDPVTKHYEARKIGIHQSGEQNISSEFNPSKTQTSLPTVSRL